MIELIGITPAGTTTHLGEALTQFPGGEWHVRDFDLEAGSTLLVVVRGANADDLAAAAIAADRARSEAATVVLALPYLPGARADRGRPLGARVYAEIANAVHADRVLTIDPHSPVMPSLLERIEDYPLGRFVRSQLSRLVAGEREHPYVGVIAPDEGAAARASSVAHALHVPVFHARKHRDFTTGKLSGFSCQPLPDSGRLLVVDDIADGGGTLTGLAEVTGLGPDRLDLWITHSVFSRGSERLRTHFGTIHTTDSHPGHTNPAVGATIHPLTPLFIQEAQS